MQAQLRHPQVAMVSPTGHPSMLLLVSQEQPVPVGWDLPPKRHPGLEQEDWAQPWRQQHSGLPGVASPRP